MHLWRHVSPAAISSTATFQPQVARILVRKSIKISKSANQCENAHAYKHIYTFRHIRSRTKLVQKLRHLHKSSALIAEVLMHTQSFTLILYTHVACNIRLCVGLQSTVILTLPWRPWLTTIFKVFILTYPILLACS